MAVQTTVREMIGQVVMFGFHGRSLSEAPELERWMSEGRVANVILMARNIADAAHASELAREIQDCAGCRRTAAATVTVTRGGGVPALIAVDQEGGAVVRVSRGATVFAGNMALGSAALGGTDLAYEVGFATGTELRAMGLNVNLAPVLDVATNPDNPGIGVRSFGSDPGLVAGLGERMVKGLQDAGVAATAKHFPGKGDVSLDSHVTLPVVRHGLGRLESCELVPFARAVAAGVRVVMSSHASYTALEAGRGPRPLPGTLSREVMTGMLRCRMGFRGVAITDDLEMGAITEGYDVAEAAVAALNAGADLLLACHAPERQRAVLGALEEAVASGVVPVARLAEAAARVRELKSWLAARQADEPEAAGAEAKRDHARLQAELARAAVAVAYDPDGVLPVASRNGEPVVVVAPAAVNLLRPQVAVEERVVGGEPTPRTPLWASVHSRCPAALGVVVGADPGREEAARWSSLACETFAGAGGRGLLFVGTYNAHLRPGQLAFVQDLLARKPPGVRAVVVALRNPFDLRELACSAGARNAAFVAAYNYDEVCCEAAVAVAFGELVPRGRVPVPMG